MTILLSTRRFADIPQFIKPSSAGGDVGWRYLDGWFETWGSQGLDMTPDFQRGRVWTRAQQIAFVEYALRGGLVGPIYWNELSEEGAAGGARVVLVDGLQRLTAIQAFLNNTIPAFGVLYNAFEDTLRGMDMRVRMVVHNLGTRAEVLRWYLELNAGGTPHTPDELARVQRLLDEAVPGTTAAPV